MTGITCYNLKVVHQNKYQKALAFAWLLMEASQ